MTSPIASDRFTEPTQEDRAEDDEGNGVTTTGWSSHAGVSGF